MLPMNIKKNWVYLVIGVVALFILIGSFFSFNKMYFVYSVRVFFNEMVGLDEMPHGSTPLDDIITDPVHIANIQSIPADVYQFPNFQIASPDNQWLLDVYLPFSETDEGDYETDTISISKVNMPEGKRLLHTLEEDTFVCTSDHMRSGTVLPFYTPRVFWSSDGKQVFYCVQKRSSAETERWIESIDIATNKITRYTEFVGDYYAGYDGVNLQSFATARYPDDIVLYSSASNGTISAKTKSGVHLWTAEGRAPYYMSPDKKKVSVNSVHPDGNSFYIYDVENGKLLHTIDPELLGGFGSSDLLWSPDSTRFVYDVLKSGFFTGSEEAAVAFVLYSDAYIINIDGTGRKKLVGMASKVLGRSHQWLQDGGIIFSGEKDYYKVDLALEDATF